MSNETKACMLTEREIETLINHHGYSVNGINEDQNFDERIERMRYLNNRRKAFHEEEKNKAAEVSTSNADQAANKVVNETTNQKWPTNG